MALLTSFRILQLALVVLAFIYTGTQCTFDPISVLAFVGGLGSYLWELVVTSKKEL